MTLTTHATMGAVIGTIIPNPFAAFIVSFVVHLLVDIIPHGDSRMSDNYRIHRKKRKQAVAYVALDSIIAIFFVLFIMDVRDIDRTPALTWGIAGGVLPDMLVAIYELTKTKYLRWFFRLHFYFHDMVVKRKGDIPLHYGLLAQIIVISILQLKLK